MKNWNRLCRVLAAGALTLVAAGAQAATAPSVLVSGSTDAIVAPGSTATTSFSVQFAGDYEFIGMGINMFYDANFMSFNPAQSSVSLNSTVYTLPAFLGLLDSLAGTPGYVDFTSFGGESSPGELFFGAGFTTTGSKTLNGSILVQTAFDLLPGFVAGTKKAVTVSGLSFTDTVSGTADLASPDKPFTMTITALAPVPEPESWLMLLVGLGLLGGLTRRRAH